MGQFEKKKNRKVTPIAVVSKKHPHKQTIEEEIIGLAWYDGALRQD
jgi:hypothetical protein